VELARPSGISHPGATLNPLRRLAIFSSPPTPDRRLVLWDQYATTAREAYSDYVVGTYLSQVPNRCDALPQGRGVEPGHYAQRQTCPRIKQRADHPPPRTRFRRRLAPDSRFDYRRLTASNHQKSDVPPDVDFFFFPSAAKKNRQNHMGCFLLGTSGESATSPVWKGAKSIPGARPRRWRWTSGSEDRQSLFGCRKRASLSCTPGPFRHQIISMDDMCRSGFFWERSRGNKIISRGPISSAPFFFFF